MEPTVIWIVSAVVALYCYSVVTDDDQWPKF